MQQNKQLIYYETFDCKVNLRYTNFLQSPEVIKLEDVICENDFCYGSDEYIKRFIESIKDKVIKYLPNLNNVQIILGIFDKDNLIHQIMVTIITMMSKILKKEISKINHYKSIIVVIKYEGKDVFIGSINFDGIK